LRFGSADFAGEIIASCDGEASKPASLDRLIAMLDRRVCLFTVPQPAQPWLWPRNASRAWGF